jgi:hypothetical protein
MQKTEAKLLAEAARYENLMKLYEDLQKSVKEKAGKEEEKAAEQEKIRAEDVQRLLQNYRNKEGAEKAAKRRGKGEKKKKLKRKRAEAPSSAHEPRGERSGRPCPGPPPVRRPERASQEVVAPPLPASEWSAAQVVEHLSEKKPFDDIAAHANWDGAEFIDLTPEDLDEAERAYYDHIKEANNIGGPRRRGVLAVVLKLRGENERASEAGQGPAV